MLSRGTSDPFQGSDGGRQANTLYSPSIHAHLHAHGPCMCVRPTPYTSQTHSYQLLEAAVMQTPLSERVASLLKNTIQIKHEQ